MPSPFAVDQSGREACKLEPIHASGTPTPWKEPLIIGSAELRQQTGKLESIINYEQIEMGCKAGQNSTAQTSIR